MPELVFEQLAPNDENTRRSMWCPYMLSHEGFNVGWWGRPRSLNQRASTFHRVLQGRNEVARLELDWTPRMDHYDPTMAVISLLEIEFFEVHADHRLRGLGHQVVAELVSRYPGRRLMALSEGADGFWLSVGWARYEHPEHSHYPHRYRPLFLAP